MSLVVKDVYTGSGTTGPFDYSFRIDSESQLKAYTLYQGVATLLTGGGTDYTVSNIGNAAGGSITLTSSLASGRKLVIFYSPQIQPTAEFIGLPRIPQGTLDREIQRIFAAIAAVNQKVAKCVQFVDAFDDSTFTPTLPDPYSLVANGLIKVNAAKTGFEAGPTVEALEALNTYVDSLNAVSALLSTSIYEITNGQSAANLADDDSEDYDTDDYTSIVFEVEVLRGTTVVDNFRMFLQNVDGVWRLIQGPAAVGGHGVTFTVDQTDQIGTIQVAADSGAGDGTVKIKKVYFAVAA